MSSGGSSGEGLVGQGGRSSGGRSSGEGLVGLDSGSGRSTGSSSDLGLLGLHGKVRSAIGGMGAERVMIAVSHFRRSLLLESAFLFGTLSYLA